MPGTEDQSFETDDLYLAAYYMYAGCKYVGKRKIGPTKVIFIFRNDGGASHEELEKAFISGEAVGRLHDYALKIVAAKKLLFI